MRRLRQNRREGSARSTASIILDSSLEVRSAIIYATLIDVVAVTPVFFIEGLSGAFFQPLDHLLRAGGARLTARGADGDARDGATSSCATCRPSDRESPIARRLQDGYQRVLSRIVAPPAADLRQRGGRPARRHRGLPAARPVAASRLQGTRLPHALGHEAGDVASGGGPDLDARLHRAPGDRGRSELRLAHRPGAAGRRGRRHRLRRELDQRRSRCRLRRDARVGAGGRRRLPGPAARRADLPEGADP